MPETRDSPRSWPWLRIAIAVVVIALIAVYVRQVDWTAIVRSTADASVLLLVVATLLNVPLIALKAMRMRLFVGGQIATGRLMGFYVASYAADNLLMSQAGLGLRVGLLHRDGVPLVSAVTVQALEKLVEGVGLALVALPLLAIPDLDPTLATIIRWGLVVGGIALVALVAVALLRHRNHPFVRRIAETVHVLRDGKVASRVLALTMGAWAIEVAMVFVTLVALHLPVPSIATAALVLVAVNVAALVPGLPANIGAFEMAAMLALASVGVGREAALAFAIVYHASHTIPVTLLGLVGLHRASRPAPAPLDAI
jgi:hypothetical protein